MAEKRRLNLSFSMASPLQRDAWKILCAVPSGQRTEAVCRAVCKSCDESALLDAIRNVVREELQSIEFSAQKEQTQTGDVNENVLGFLLALQNDGGDEKTGSLF